MNSPYLWLKVVHVLLAGIWFGSAVSLFAILSRISPATDRRKLAGLAAACDFVGSRVIAPAAGLTLIAGLTAMWLGKVGMALWIWWGIVAAVLVMAVGGSALRMGFTRLATMLDDAQTPDATIAAHTKRLRTIGMGVIAVLVLTVIVMVMKPV